MSLQASALLLLYRLGRLPAEALVRAVADGLITEDERREILALDQ